MRNPKVIVFNTGEIGLFVEDEYGRLFINHNDCIGKVWELEDEESAGDKEPAFFEFIGEL